MNLKKIKSLEDWRKVCHVFAKRYDLLSQFAFNPENETQDRIRSFMLAHHTKFRLDGLNFQITQSQFKTFQHLLSEKEGSTIIGVKPEKIIKPKQGLILPLDYKKKK